MTLQAQYTSTTTAFRLTATPASGVALPLTDPSKLGTRPVGAYLQATTANVRFTADGVTIPTASVGAQLVAGDTPFLYYGALNQLQFIRESAGAVLNVIYTDAPQPAQGAPGATGATGATGAAGSVPIDLSGGHTFTAVGATAGAYTLANSGIVVKNDAGDETGRVWFTDPDIVNNYNSGNLYIGLNSGLNATTNNTDSGYQNVGVGVATLRDITTGSMNSALGVNALQSIGAGGSNVAVGTLSLVIATGSANTALGEESFIFLTDGAENIGIGQFVGANLAGDANTKIVHDTKMVLLGNLAHKNNAATLTNGIGVGYDVEVLASNTAVIGNASVTKVALGSADGLANSVQAQVFITGITAPADGAIAANQVVLYFDPTNGAAKLMAKGKQADGTVVGPVVVKAF